MICGGPKESAQDQRNFRERRENSDADLHEELVKLAKQKPCYGYGKLHAVPERRGQAGNVTRVYRLYAEEGLAVRWRKVQTAAESCVLHDEVQRRMLVNDWSSRLVCDNGKL